LRSSHHSRPIPTNPRRQTPTKSPSPNATPGNSPGSLGSTSKKGMTPWRHCCLVRQTEPRVSPVPRGRNGQAQDHASKEETAPAGVAVVSIGSPQARFSPRPKTKTPANRRRVDEETGRRLEPPSQKAPRRRWRSVDHQPPP
jgi:hypothetical protein